MQYKIILCYPYSHNNSLGKVVSFEEKNDTYAQVAGGQHFYSDNYQSAVLVRVDKPHETIVCLYSKTTIK